MAAIFKTYPSKITYWLYLPILGFVFYFFIKSIVDMHWLYLIMLTVAFGLILLPMLFNTYYAIKDTTLNVKSGLIINIDIDINKIKKITLNNTIWSAPALSTDRIEIFYNTYDSVIISPQNKKDFIETLKQINPAIVSEV
jgi:hypothetical protein